MAEQPPPYSSSEGSHRYAGNFTYTIALHKAPEWNSLAVYERFTHQHDGYIIAVPLDVTTVKGQRVMKTIAIWLPKNADTNEDPVIIPVFETFEPDVLEYVESFEDCGVFRFSHGGVVPDTAEAIQQAVCEQVSRHLATRRERPGRSDDTSTPSGQEQAGHNPDVQHLLSIHVYKISIFSEYAESIVNPAGNSKHFLFNWIKAESNYGPLQGQWNASLVDVVKDGMFRGGRHLKVLVRGVSDQAMEAEGLSM